MVVNKIIKNGFLCLLAFVSFCANDSTAQTLSDYDLVGKVKRLCEYHYNLLDGCDYCEELQCDSTRVDFNVNGKAIKRTFFTCSFLESEKGQVFTDTYNYKWNANGKIIEMERKGLDNGIVYTKYIRDDKGYAIRIEDYFKKQLIHVYYRKNWEDGTVKETSSYNYWSSEKKLEERYFFNEKGMLIKTVYYSNDGQAYRDEQYKYEYHTNGNISKCTKIDSRGGKYITIYNEKGLTSTYTYYSDGKVYESKTYTYKYDTYGNWINLKIIKKDHYFNKETVDILKRKITYYN